ncbi:hypothetical protein HMPREF9140_00047 [Prevotella micans F0438]|uniref:DUF4834 domain-containing protein n=1 Tax=Prevotella micans F0438 TaxID=883158 RepID=H1PZF9_9BACT|nr:DUF4834 family protein [Prevotella micans]EHO75004.1 hypothetical protein HMPREF9140_00047 [Prevotella micans F0438]MBF1435288.1 DUF4834 family protein [Prevotella micans]
MIFLSFIFFIFIGFFIIILSIAISFYRQIRDTSRKFRPGDRTGRNNQPKPNADGNIIIDSRSESQRNRKIISDDEGEYVDFS